MNRLNSLLVLVALHVPSTALVLKDSSELAACELND